jgi:hypothetical protein
MLAEAIYYKYKDDPIRSKFVIRGTNWWDVEIIEDDGSGEDGESGISARSATQLSKAEVETAIEEWIVAKAADPTLLEPPAE